NGMGQPAALWQLEPNRVRPDRTARGDLFYRVLNADGTQTSVAPADMVHVLGPTFDGVIGYSPALMGKESIGVGLAAEKFTGTFFGNGSTFGGFISVPEPYSDERLKQYRTQFETRHQGPEKAHKLGIL